MVDFATARTRMVDNQLRTNDVTDLAIQDAMGSVPRESFVGINQRPLAYIDEDLPLGDGARFLMKPYVFAKMLQAVALQPKDDVLVVGSGCGYSAAVLAHLASTITALESDTALADQSRIVLEQLGADQVTVITGPLAGGHAASAPYDVILVEGAVETLSPAWAGQLRDGGRLIVVEGHGRAGRVMIYARSGAEVSGRLAFNAAVKPLPGFAKAPAFVF